MWFEQLSLAIGSSALSLAVLLATFMGGLGLGSLLASRGTGASYAPLRRYALVELGIGVLGLVTLAAIPLLAGAYTALSGTGGLALLLRLVVAALALLPATMLMGATLPIVAPWLGGDRRGAARLGWCYAANTVGGVAGSLLAGFYLLRVHDAYVATFVAVALNIGSAAVAAALSRRNAAPSVAAAPVDAPSAMHGSGGARRIYLVTALSGMTALAAEVLWTRHLTLLLGATVYAFASIVAVFLLGIGLGSAAGAAIGRRFDPTTALGICQLLLGFAIAAAAYALAESLPYWPIDVTLPTTVAVALQLDLLRASVVALPAALLWGASFPLALAAAVAAGAEPRRAVGRLYAANTLGAIVGALGYDVRAGRHDRQPTDAAAHDPRERGCGARPALGSAQRGGARRLLAALPRRVALAVAALTVQPLPPELIAFGRFLPTRGFDANVVYVGEGLTASVAVSAEPDGTLTYHNAGKTQASTYPQDMRLQRMLGHLTTLVPERARSVLVIGLGAGITAGAVSIDPAVERVVVAELEPLVPAVAARVLRRAQLRRREQRQGRDSASTTADTCSRRRRSASTPSPPTRSIRGSKARPRSTHASSGSSAKRGSTTAASSRCSCSSTRAPRTPCAASSLHSSTCFRTARCSRIPLTVWATTPCSSAARATSRSTLRRLERRLDRSDYETRSGSLRAVGFDSALDLMSTYAADAESLAPWLEGAARNTDRDLRLQYLAGEGLNVLVADEIFAALVGSGPALPARLFTGTPAQLEELEQRLAGRQGRY